MSRVFECMMTKLSEESGYDYDFLTDVYSNMVDDGIDDWDYFVGTTMNHDW